MGIKEHKFLTSFSFLLSLISIGMVSYLILLNPQQKYQFTLALEQQNHQNQLLKKEIEQEKQFVQNTMLQMQNQLTESQKQTPAPEIAHLIWLVHAAKWQINLLNQSEMAIKLLTTAQKQVAKTSWDSINDAIGQDIAQIQALNLTSAATIIQIVSELKANITQQTPMMVQSHVVMHQPQHKILELLSPYLKIEKYQNQPKRITPPTEQIIVLNNLLLLLPEIQFAALNHQQDVYQLLIQQFAENVQLLPKNTKIIELLEKLKTAKIQIQQPLYFHSLTELENLLHIPPAKEESL